MYSTARPKSTAEDIAAWAEHGARSMKEARALSGFSYHQLMRWVKEGRIRWRRINGRGKVELCWRDVIAILHSMPGSET